LHPNEELSSTGEDQHDKADCDPTTKTRTDNGQFLHLGWEDQQIEDEPTEDGRHTHKPKPPD
jgi:hypothetical protein